jgi:Glu-tRNA(Gln) amidotransferase subunit E-like FAD-binding protein
MKTNQNSPSSFDQRVSGRSKKMGLSAKPEFCEKLRRFSYEERRLQIEILEEALQLYENKKKTKQQTLNIYQLLGVNHSQEIKTFLDNRTLPRLDYDIKDLANKVSVYRQTIQAIEQQMQVFQGNMN